MADTTRNVAIRYSLDSSDVRAQLDQLGQTGDAAMQKIGDATDAVTPKLDALQSKTDATADSVKALSATAPGMSPLTDAMNAYGDAVAKTGAGLAELFDDSVSLTQNLADLKAGTDAAGAATVQLFQSLATGALATADSNYAKTLAADIRDMMRATGDSFASYAATADAAKALNTDAASASAMIDHLRGVIVGTDDASKAARATLEGLGISLQDAVPSDAPAILQAFIDKEQQYADSRQKTAAIEQVTGQSSVAALKSIAAAQDFTNQKTQAAAALQGELTLRSQQAAGDIAAIKAKPGYIDEIIASIAKATTVSDEWAADSALSSQQVGQGFEKAAVGAKEIDFGAIHDGWMQARLGLEDYVQSIQADLIPSISRYLGLTTNRVPVTIQSDGRQAQPDAPDDATIEAVNRYSSALDLERQTLQLTDQQQKDVKESASAYNDVMNIFSGKSPQWVSQHGDLIKSLTDEKIVTDTVSEAVSNQAKVKDDFKKVNLDLANDLETLNGIQEQAAKQAAADEQRRQDVIKGIKDQTTAEVALLDAYRQGKDVYQTVQEVEAILTAQRQLGKGATDDEKDAVANLTTTLFESKSALEAAQKATQDKAEADKKAAAAAVEAQKKFAEQEVTVAKDISSSVATYLVDGLTKSTTTGKTLFQNLWDTALEGAKRFAVKVAATLLEQQILLPITLSLVNSAPSLFGVGNATALASALTGGGGSAFGTVASGASLLSAGNSLTGGGSIFGSSGLLGGLFGGGSAALPAVTGLTDFGAAGSSFLVPAFGEGAAASGVGAAGGLFGSLGGIGLGLGVGELPFAGLGEQHDDRVEILEEGNHIVELRLVEPVDRLADLGGIERVGVQPLAEIVRGVGAEGLAGRHKLAEIGPALGGIEGRIEAVGILLDDGKATLPVQFLDLVDVGADLLCRRQTLIGIALFGRQRRLQGIVDRLQRVGHLGVEGAGIGLLNGGDCRAELDGVGGVGGELLTQRNELRLRRGQRVAGIFQRRVEGGRPGLDRVDLLRQGGKIGRRRRLQDVIDGRVAGAEQMLGQNVGDRGGAAVAIERVAVGAHRNAGIVAALHIFVQIIFVGEGVDGADDLLGRRDRRRDILMVTGRLGDADAALPGGVGGLVADRDKAIVILRRPTE